MIRSARAVARRRLRAVKGWLPGEVVHQGRLSNGLSVLVSPKRGFSKRFAIFSTLYGSCDNEFSDPATGATVRVPGGIAHFLEHELFAQESGDAFDEFARNGASANAATSFSTTSYLFACTEQFEKNLRLLLEFVGTPYFTEANVDKERGIIGQEIKMYDDNADWRIFMNLMMALYHRHPIRIDIAGTVESIAEITPKTLHQCYRTFYHPSNMALVVVGDVDPEGVARMADEITQRTASRAHAASKNGASRANGAIAPIRRLLPKEPRVPAQREVTQSLVVSLPRVAIGFKEAVPLPSGRELARRETVTHLLFDVVFGRSSELFNRLYEQGVIDDSFSGSYTADDGYGFSVISGETADPDRFVREIRSGIARARRDGICDEDFLRIRRKAIGKFVKQFNSPESVAYTLLSHHIRGLSIHESYRDLQRITRREVEARLAEHLTPRQSAVSRILPKASASA
ncbi:MAG: insulinase family protein [Planctomycetes bacterium]|nr:insulinase family protein [Planctomycetota bacterium]MBI3847921.1 insulinase family protein [Planctomycetota bacterium]